MVTIHGPRAQPFVFILAGNSCASCWTPKLVLCPVWPAVSRPFCFGRYATNRVTQGDLDGLISCFTLDEAGVPTLKSTASTHGKVPRDMTFTSDGAVCIAANQNSDNLSTYQVNPVTGALNHIFTTEPTVLSPVSLLVV